jgi:hypothetical protein
MPAENAGVELTPTHGHSGNQFDLLLYAAAVLLREVAAQVSNVSGTFAQRWDADRKHIQGIVQVTAAVAILHHFGSSLRQCRDSLTLHEDDAGVVAQTRTVGEHTHVIKEALRASISS